MLQTFNLQKTKKIVKIGTLFIVIIIALLAIGLFTSNRENQPQKISRQDLILNLPYITKEFSVVYSSKRDQIYVNTKAPYEQNRQKALEWIKSQRVDPETLKIFYTPRSANPNPVKENPWRLDVTYAT